MFGKIELPVSLLHSELDAYLKNGWFRMGQSLFTCNVLNFKRQFYSAVWLRIPLNNYEKDSTFKKLRKINSAFEVKIRPAIIDPAKEDLYTKYKTGISFDTASSLIDLLLDPTSEHSIFDTYEVCVYDQAKLIATGFFDLGENSAAGIVSFYDPDYKKYSLGKYLIYNKIEFCKTLHLDYFYPGYFAPSYPMFDYKLDIGKSALEFFNIKTNRWQSYASFSDRDILITEIEDKLDAMQMGLHRYDVPTMRLKYEFYNANNIPRFRNLELFDYPEFLFVISNKFSGFVPILVYDVRNEKYRLLKCLSYFFDENYVSNGQYYGANLMKIGKELFVDEDIETFVALFASEVSIDNLLA